MKKQAIYMLLILLITIMAAGCGDGKDKDSSNAGSSDIVQVEKSVTGFMNVFRDVAAKEQKDRGKNPLEKAKSLLVSEDAAERLNTQLAHIDRKFTVTYKVVLVEINDENEPLTARAKIRGQAKSGNETNDAEMEFELVNEKGKWLISDIDD